MQLSKRPIYFAELGHKYTNDAGEEFISSTTLVGKYEHKFDEDKLKIAKLCEKIGKNPNHPKYNKYKDKTYKQILAKWQDAGDVGRKIGNTKHNYLEEGVKSSNGFYDVFKTRYSSRDNNAVRLYTIEDIMDNHNYGDLNLAYFEKHGIKDKYPKIYNILENFVNDGWKIYSEIGVFDFDNLISGLVDLLVVKNKEFVILDWKTMNAPIRFEAGYWDKDKDGNRLGYLTNGKMLKPPLHKLGKSTGNKIALQLSLYAYMIEQFGYTHIASVICHITHDNYKIGDKDLETNPNWIGKNRIDIVPVSYLKQDIINMIGHYSYHKNNGQRSLY